MDVVALASANWGSSLWSFFLICGANRTAMCNGGFLHSMALGIGICGTGPERLHIIYHLSERASDEISFVYFGFLLLLE